MYKEIFPEDYVADWDLYENQEQTVLDIFANTDCHYRAAVAASGLVYHFGWSYAPAPGRAVLVIAPDNRMRVIISASTVMDRPPDF